MEKIVYTPIGIIRSAYKHTEGVPIQSTAAAGSKGSVEIAKTFEPGLEDLGGFSHVILLYHFHRAGKYRLRVQPFLDNHRRGLFATRAPARPNAIGLSVVHLIKIVGNVLLVDDLDILDGTPLLDIKPYVPPFDQVGSYDIGWMEKHIHKLNHTASDDRFS